MKRFSVMAVTLAAGLAVGASFALPQQLPQTPSLGELARQLKAERGNEQRPAKVYTNDNIPKTGALSEVGSESSSTSGKTTASSETGSGAEANSKSGAHDEKYYHDKMRELQSQKEMHQRELDVLQQKLNLNQTQYYSDPQKTLTQETMQQTPDSDISKKRAAIDKKKQQIAADQKAIDDLEQQCQREGCPPGWLR